MNTKYYYWLKSCNDDGCSAYTSSANSTTAFVDAPSNLIANPDSTSQITLTWGSATEATRYEIYRHSSDDSSAAAMIISQSGSDYTNTGLSKYTTYYYWVKTCNANGCSSYTSSIGITTLAIETPANIYADTSPFKSSEMMVSWSSVKEATYYEIYRSTTFDMADSIKLVRGTTSFTDTNLSANTTYYYQVKACNANGCSGTSYTTGKTAIIDTPTDLRLTPDGTGQITLNWTSTTGATYYEVYRNTSDNGNSAVKISSQLVVNGTSFINTGLTASATYYYWIKACNDSGCYTYSNSASATIAAIDAQLT